MTATPQAATENNKEANFRAQEKAMRDHYEAKLAQERAERERIARELEQARKAKEEEEEETAEPYVDPKTLEKKLSKHGQKQKQEVQTEIQKAMVIAKEEARREAWLENHNDFNEILQHAEKLAQKSPSLANSILSMPEGFERSKLAYETIKELGLHKPAERKETIQDKIEANKRGQFYQPSGIGSAPYQGQRADFSKSGQEAAYKKMKDLISNVRLS